jgi:hypothetical protein
MLIFLVFYIKYYKIFLIFVYHEEQYIFINETKAWIKRKNGPDEVVRIVLNLNNGEPVTSYLLYTAFEETADYLGRLLFDIQGYWIYDGDSLTIAEQEQVAKFIINHIELI